MESTTVLLLPGLWNSGPDHWQSHWEAAFPICKRVVQHDWETPRAEDWIERLQEQITAMQAPVVLAAHSLGCALVARWAQVHGKGVDAALLVAPSDTEAPSYPSGTTGFVPMPLQRLPFRSIVAASTDDPYVSLERARFFAQAWGAQFHCVGPKGHIGTAAKLGMWDEGLDLLQRLRA
jgi:predicted alpha/beta hydrolase family esterase